MKWLQTIILAIIILGGFVGYAYFESSIKGNSGSQGKEARAAMSLELASSLKGYELYPEAIREYERYLDLAAISSHQRASILYTVGAIELDKLFNPRAALSRFLASAKLLDDNDALKKDADLKIVQCLESLNRSLDASNRLEEVTSLGGKDKPGRDKSDEIIAKVGSEEITVAEIEAAIQKMPAEFQKGLHSGQARAEFLKSYVVKRLLLHAAERKGLKSDPEVLDAINRVREEAMIAKFMASQIGPVPETTLDEAKLYYEQHEDEFKVKGKGKKKARAKPFKDVKATIMAKLKGQKQSAKVSELIERLRSAEGVVIYNNK